MNPIKVTPYFWAISIASQVVAETLPNIGIFAIKILLTNSHINLPEINIRHSSILTLFSKALPIAFSTTLCLDMSSNKSIGVHYYALE